MVGCNITKTYTTFKIAKILDVYPSTVAGWVDRGTLKAYVTPGGHRRVQREDLISFMRIHNMPIPSELEDSGVTSVLIVDDDEMVLNAVTRMLEKSPDYTFKIKTASDGFEAGQLVSVLRPHLILLDIMLPSLDGFKVCETVRQQYPDMKIIAMSGYASQENKDRILKLGANAFLSKPFEMEDLFKTISFVM